ncbi:hypothetical protein C8R44DRAFT_855335 [Mycena epipterygia]|nr:hypothetical protein C8R44DRAFT_855335 [Mycena epipterygia]
MSSTRPATGADLMKCMKLRAQPNAIEKCQSAYGSLLATFLPFVGGLVTSLIALCCLLFWAAINRVHITLRVTTPAAQIPKTRSSGFARSMSCRPRQPGHLAAHLTVIRPFRPRIPDPKLGIWKPLHPRLVLLASPCPAFESRGLFHSLRARFRLRRIRPLCALLAPDDAVLQPPAIPLPVTISQTHSPHPAPPGVFNVPGASLHHTILHLMSFGGRDTGDHRSVSIPPKTGHPTTKDAGPGFMSTLHRPLTSSRRILQYGVSSSAPEASAVNDCRPPLRSRPSFEVDLSPIIEDIHSFPNLPSSFDGFNMLPDQSVSPTCHAARCMYRSRTAERRIPRTRIPKTTIQEILII